MSLRWLRVIALAAFMSAAAAPVRAQHSSEGHRLAYEARQVALRHLAIRHGVAPDRGAAPATLLGPTQRTCLDRTVSEIDALAAQAEALAERAGPTLALRLERLDEQARLCRSTTREREGDVEVSVRGRWRHERLSRDRFHLVAGLAFADVIRVQGADFGPHVSVAARVGLRRYLLPRVRVELFGTFGRTPRDKGPIGSVGVSAALAARWSLFRVAFGPSLEAVFQRDAVFGDAFGSFGLRYAFPLEIGFEPGARVGFSVYFGPSFRRDESEAVRLPEFVYGAQLEVVL